jgi:hypothetical protein
MLLAEGVNAFPLKWKYNNPQRRIRCDSSGSVD